MRERGKKGDTFFYITNFKGKFNLSSTLETGDMFCNNCFKEGNYFLTKKDGEKAIKVISKNIFKYHSKCRATNDIKKER